MSGYIGTKSVTLSTTSASVGGDSTVGGDLTVDTNTLYVDSTNNRIGVGTVLPTSELTIGADSPQIDLYKISSADVLANIRAETDAGSGGKLVFQTKRNGNTALDRMTIDDDGNVGIGTSSPQKTLDVRGELAISNSTTSYWSLNRDDTDGSLTFTDTNVSERMRIDSSGNLLFEHTDFASGWGATNKAAIAVGANYKFWSSRDSTTSRGHIIFYNPNGAVGSITTSGSATAYNTSSDYRLKENVTDVTDGITRVKQLEPKRFNFIADPDTTVDGFLAHQAQAVVPEAVTGTHNEVDDDGNAVMQGIDQSKLVPLLTAALKEAITKIETLETEMTSVKARLDALEGN